MDTPLKIGRSAPTSPPPMGAPGEPIHHIKPAVDPATLTHKHLLDGPFWHNPRSEPGCGWSGQAARNGAGLGAAEFLR